MKKKTTSPSPSVVESAWAAFFESNKKTSLKELASAGWKSVKEIATESGLSNSSAYGRMILDKRFETMVAKVFDGKITRDIRLFRPKVS